LNFNDFLEQMKQVKNMGGAKEMLAMLPGMGGSAALKDADIDEKEIDRTEAIIYSMTKDERERPAILNGSRRRRIAEGSGSAIQDVNQLLKSFDQAKKIMKKMGGSKFTPSKKDRKKKGKKGSRKNSLRSLFR
jgi:signal recognition particle subunit SRP54